MANIFKEHTMLVFVSLTMFIPPALVSLASWLISREEGRKVLMLDYFLMVLFIPHSSSLLDTSTKAVVKYLK